ncbi:unnamed protein product [Brachionus calyciflorus]|uniref:FLYWCH-type domain-containing protein n=1 Tax=Brachionus calyciflorus TaxID=104777 RepID=A0A814PA70_9BILA|nr:unnamed protein product [Brachionus calyciflorus]
MSEFTLIPTHRGEHYLFYEHQLSYKVKPKNPFTGITSWRCRRYHDENVKCKALLKATDDRVISQSNNHENHEKVKQTETIMMSAKQDVKNMVSGTRGPVKRISEETICKMIDQNSLTLRDVSNFVPKYKNCEKT